MSSISFQVLNPYNNILEAQFDFETIDQALFKANDLNKVFNVWRNFSINDRSNLIAKFSEFLEDNKTEIAKLISTDMGKPIMQSFVEIEKSIDCCKFYIENIENIQLRLKQPQFFHEPIGVVLGIMPWNFPLWQIIRFLIPAIISGNVCLIKPAYNCFRIANFLLKFFESGIIKFFDIVITEDVVTEKLIVNEIIKGVSLTGSVSAGQKVANLASQSFKNLVLELGGSDPFIICKDANLNKAITNLVSAKFLNSGQTCIAPKRIYFEADIFDEAMNLFVKKTEQFIRFGDPIDKKVNFGPIARLDIKLRLDHQIKSAGLAKQNIVYNRSDITKCKNYFAPLVIDARNFSHDHILLKEEVFGPVAVCRSFSNIDDVINEANESSFGLGASIWTNNPEIKNFAAKNLDHGIIGINSTVKSDPKLPFGGRKNSGFGIELGIDGVLSFTNYKTIIQ